MKPGHFDRTFMENMIGDHISDDGVAKVKESERKMLKALYLLMNDAWKCNNMMAAVRFWDRFRDCFVLFRKVEGTIASCNGGGSGNQGAPTSTRRFDGLLYRKGEIGRAGC